MILPQKHLTIDESLLGFGAFLLKHISKKISVDELWKKYTIACEEGVYPIVFSFDKFILTIDFLYLIGAVNLNEKGELIRALSQTDCG